MAQSSAPEAGEAAAQARAKILEGVDFIETEEDAEAVESAVVKIQSTFRGKKIRSKLGGAQSKQPATTSASASTSASTKTANAESASNSTRASDSKQTSTDTKKPSEAAAASAKQAADEELNKRVAKMQVNDNSDAHEPQKGNNVSRAAATGDDKGAAAASNKVATTKTAAGTEEAAARAN